MLHSLIQITPETEKLASLICTAAPAEKIFLLGGTQMQKRTSSIFNPEQPTCKHIVHYFVLVLVNKNDEQSLTCLQDKIENNLQHFIPVTAIVINTTQFNNWLGEGHAFATDVVTKALLLYDNGLALTAAATADATAIAQSRQQYFNKGLLMMHEFLAGAEMYRIRKQHAMAAFMLHQSVEHGLRCFMKTTTGLRTNTHNIDRLVRLCSMAVHGLAELFNKEQPEDKILMQKLQSAYIDARYKEFSIKEHELTAIEEKVKQLMILYKRMPIH